MPIAPPQRVSTSHLRRRIEQLIEHPKQQWCAVYTKPQKEDFAEMNLRQRGIPTFLPKLSLPKAANRKKQIVSLFPSYLFVRLNLFSEEHAAVGWCPGVKRLLAFEGTPAIVDESLIQFLMDQTNPGGIISSRCNVTVGQEVAIEGGPFDGLVGIIQEPPNARGRVKVLLELLKRPMKVDVPVQFIKASWVAAGPTPGFRPAAYPSA
jgi:transcriptional antiterminator RfaH